MIPDSIGEEGGRHIYGELDRFRSRLWKDPYLDRVGPFPGVRELLRRILRDGKQIVLASSAKGDEPQKCRKIAMIDDLVKDETSADDVNRSEAVTGSNPRSAGNNRVSDATTAIAIMIGGGFPEKESRVAGCVAIYRHPAELLDQYDASPLTEADALAA